ncbi:MAG: TlpA family protein disulfide reductase [Desulfitobacteriaceae bacterium]
MGTVLREVAALFPELNFETVYVEIQVEEANHYRIKTNPTTLFVDENGIELYRLDGFHETNIVKDTIEKIIQKKIELAPELAENTETVEKYFLYLLKDGEFSPVEAAYTNRTSIKAPRITAITLLIQAAKAGYDNPFPPGTTLELVQFRDTIGIITLKLTTDVDQATLARMKEALQQTLSRYGITQVELAIAYVRDKITNICMGMYSSII